VAVNRDKPDLWKPDIAQSVDMYNDWFMRFAPLAFRDTRVRTSQEVVNTLLATANLQAADLDRGGAIRDREPY